MTDTTAAPAAKPGFYDTLMLTDRAACARAIRWGGIAASVNAAWAAAYAARVLLKGAAVPEGLLLLGGALLVAVLAVFVFRGSRAAATLLLLHFMATKVVFWAQSGATTGLVSGTIFILFYFFAMRATYVWHARYAGTAA